MHPRSLQCRSVSLRALLLVTARRASACALLIAGLIGEKPAIAAPAVLVLGDMEKPTGAVTAADSVDYLKEGNIVLHGAGNEVVAFQLLLQAGQVEAALDVRVSDLVCSAATIASNPNISLFLAHYVKTSDASYGWGEGGGGVLDWRGIEYPDALVPFHDPYSPGREAVAVPFAMDPARRRNQLVWIDVFIPRGTAAGEYRGAVEILQSGAIIRQLPLRLAVHGFNLPDESHVDAFGELYRETGVMFDSGAKFKQEPEKDWPVYSRYLQMAHAHRFLATHRGDNGPLPSTAEGQPADRPRLAWAKFDRYSPYVGQVLDGGLFTPGKGYVGPSAGVGPSFFPAPFPEIFYGAKALGEHLQRHNGGIDLTLLAVLEQNAAAFWREVEARGWSDVRFFAYIMDEVDGRQDKGAGTGAAPEQTVAFHKAMRQIQDAFDRGTGGNRKISLFWTSHADASKWVDSEADLRGTISWWIPNAHALNVPFYRELASQPGQTVWFYHSGHPAVGNHAINQLGIDLRLWGLLCRRYGVDGSFWWSMMNFSSSWNEAEKNPYENPIYKRGENRWGNGVLFYPGMRLKQAGYRRNIAGPVSSMRMKAYRRGLQDFEYCRLADLAGREAEVDELLEKLIPAAFSEASAGRVKGAWSQRPSDYESLRVKLAAMIQAAK